MTTARWVELAGQMGTQRGSLGVAAGPNSIYALGGYNSQQAIQSTEVLDLAAGTWRSLPPMHSERVALCAVTVQYEVSIFSLSFCL